MQDLLEFSSTLNTYNLMHFMKENIQINVIHIDDSSA